LYLSRRALAESATRTLATPLSLYAQVLSLTEQGCAVGSRALPEIPLGGRWAHNSAVECHLHTVEVVGSNPAVPTIKSTTYRPSPFWHPRRREFLFCFVQLLKMERFTFPNFTSYNPSTFYSIRIIVGQNSKEPLDPPHVEQVSTLLYF
jgi:hypothetical protein